MFVTQMRNYLFVISFQLMFYKTLRYRLARALRQWRHKKKNRFSQVHIFAQQRKLKKWMTERFDNPCWHITKYSLK